MLKMTGINKSKSKESTFLASDEFSMTSEYRDAISFFEKFEKYELQENLAYHSTNWLLSNDDFKIIIDPPNGICKNMPTITKEWLTLLYPFEDGFDYLDYREVFQIIRELSVGIFGSNQIPNVHLEANFDESTHCQISPAYIDTRIGQHLINVDYMMKGLWHGAYFQSDKRQKWNEKWKINLDVNYYGVAETKRNILDEFISAGLISTNDDPDYKSSYNDYIDILKREKLYETEVEELFKSKVSSLEMRLNLTPTMISKFEEIFVLESNWAVDAVIKTVEEDLDSSKSEILAKIMAIQKNIIQNNLDKKQSTRRSLYMLKLISSLIPLFIGLKKRMRIPNISKMMNPLTGDDIHTERELPPLITGSNFPNIFFKSNVQKYFSLHGGVQFGLDTPKLEECCQDILDPGMLEEIRKVSVEASYIAQSQTTYQDQNPVRTVTDLSGKIYYLIPIAVETYYNQSPKKPNWVRAIGEESIKLQNKRLPFTDISMHEQFKTFFGLNEAIKNKNIMTALKTCSKKGLIAMLQTLCRKCSVTRVSKQDELGWSLMHHAAMGNKVHLIGALILQSQDINVRRYNTITETSIIGDIYKGPTPLHVATICGSINAVACLIGCGANLKSANKIGWMPIHCAAFHDKVTILNMFIARDSDIKNLPTRNAIKSSPILLAAGSGSLASLKALINLDANIKYKDSENRGVIHMATLSKRTHIIEYFIKINLTCIPVWSIFLEMLQHTDLIYIQSTVDCLEFMTKYSKKHLNDILTSGSVYALVNLLKNRESMDLLKATSSVLCNICTETAVQLNMATTSIVEISIELFNLEDLELKSQVAYIIAHMCQLDSCQKLFASLRGYEPLSKMISEAILTNNIPVLVNGVRAIESLCKNNEDNQNFVVNETTVVDHLIHFLGYKSDNITNTLFSSSSLAISSIVRGNKANQDFLITKKCVEPLLELLKQKTNITVQVSAANALEHLCFQNSKSREAFLTVKSEISLIHLLKIWSSEVKEQGLRSLWSLAGDHISGQRFIAERIGASLLIELIMTKSETLQSIGCEAIASLCKEVKISQNLILKEGGIQPLVRLLRLRTSTNKVLAETVKTLGILCIGVAHCNNIAVQTRIITEDAFPTLIEIFKRPSTDINLKIEIGYTMAALTLNHKINQMKLTELFDFCDLLQIMSTVTENTLLLRCLTTLAVFGFNNTINQFSIKKSGGLSFEIFKSFLNSDDNIDRCQSAFNMVVLAKDIVDSDQVTITSISVRILVTSLQSKEDHIIILAANLIASLCHTRAGIPDAFISLGVIEYSLQLLNASNTEVRSASAVALGYLSFNATAARILLKECRINFTLFDKFLAEITCMDSKVSAEFVDTYKRAEKIGLPYKYLECNGGYTSRAKSSASRDIKSGVSRTSDGKVTKSIRPATALPSSSYKC